MKTIDRESATSLQVVSIAGTVRCPDRHNARNRETVSMRRSTAIISGLLFFGICLCVPSATAESPRIPELPSLYDTQPSLPVSSPVPELPPDWRQLWIDALRGEEVDLRREAAQAILREHQRGNPSVEDFAPTLLDSFVDSGSDDVRLALAAALVELDYEEAAGPLAEFAENGSIAAAQVIEPALARWKFAPYLATCLARLQSPAEVSRQRVLLAIVGVREAHLREAVASLEVLVLDPHQPSDIRLPAADALGRLQSEGLLESSRQLSADTSATSLVNQIMAASLLSSHEGAETERQLLRLAVVDEPAVVALALRRLLTLNPQAIHPLAEQLLSRPDGEVRRLAAASLVAEPASDSVKRLVGLLNDPHPEVRTFVHRSLADLAQSESFNTLIRMQALRVLEADDWRGQEQAARLLAELDEDRAAERLLELLDHDRPEVRLTAAWSLRELAVDRALPDLFEFLSASPGRIDPGQFVPPPGVSRAEEDAFISYLLEWVGNARAAAATPILKRYVPKTPSPRPMSRAAAIWALGRIHEQQPDVELAQLLSDRITDDSITPYSEHEIIRACSSVALGRMGDDAALPLLESTVQMTRPGTWKQESSRWAIGQITGEIPAPHGQPHPGPRPLNAFLRPIGE